MIPVDNYGRSKLAAEELVNQAGHDGLPVSIVRPKAIVGPGRLGISEILFDWIRDNANVIVVGTGNHKFQFAHVDDIAEVSIRSCLQQNSGAFNVGAGQFGTLREDLTALIRHAESTSIIRSIPPWLSISTLMILDKLRFPPLGPWHYLTYHRPFYADIEPVKTALGWQPRYTQYGNTPRCLRLVHCAAAYAIGEGRNIHTQGTRQTRRTTTRKVDIVILERHIR